MRKEIVLASIAVVFMLAAPAGAMAAGEKVFLDNKCNKCHSVKAANINVAGAEEEEEDAAPDLSGVGKSHDAAYIKAVLKKEAEVAAREGIKGGKKHLVKFKGTDAELDELSNWLAGMK